MNSENVNKIRSNHVFGWKGIRGIIMSRKYPKKLPFRICIALAIILFLCAFIDSSKTYDLLIFLASTNVSIFPALTGFSLTAFSVCINFGNLEIAKKSVKMEGFSIYQNAIGIFAFCISVQAAVLVTSYIVKLSEKFPQLQVYDCIAWLVNAVLLALLGFLSSFAVYLIFTIVGNIFTFGQLNNLQNTNDKFVKAASTTKVRFQSQRNPFLKKSRTTTITN